jgi:hypothetical protein
MLAEGGNDMKRSLKKEDKVQILARIKKISEAVDNRFLLLGQKMEDSGLWSLNVVIDGNKLVRTVIMERSDIGFHRIYSVSRNK